MSRQGLPLQEEQSPDSSLQEEQFLQQQQRRSENLPQPWQDEARSLNLQEQFLQQQQRRSENLPQSWQDEARSLNLQEQSPQQQQTRSQNPYESWSSFQQYEPNSYPPFLQQVNMQSIYVDQGYRWFPQNIQHNQNYIVPRYAQRANLNQQANSQHIFTEQEYNIEPQNLSQPFQVQDTSQQVTYDQHSQKQMLQALSKKDEIPQDFLQDLSQYNQRIQNLQLHQTSDSDQQLEANNQQIFIPQIPQDSAPQLNTPQHIPYFLSQQQQKAGSQPQPQKQYISQNLQHAQGIHLQQHKVDSNQQSVQASNQWSRMKQRRQDKSRKSATQSHPQSQISQRLQQQQQLRPQQHQGKKDQQKSWHQQSVQASNQWSNMEQQRWQDKSQESATQSHPQHQIQERSQQQQQLSSSQQHQERKDHQRKWNQPRNIKDNNMQQQQQITPDTLATLSQLTLKDTQELNMASSTMKDCQARIPKRQKKQLKAVSSITVNTNMFKIIFKNNFLKKAVHYDVDITIKQLNKSSTVQTTSYRFSKALCRKIFEQCRSQHFSNRYPAFDGKKNAYSAYDLPFKSNILETTVDISTCNECPANCNRHSRKFIVILKKVAEIDLSWTRNLSNLDEVDGYQTGIQVLDIIMRHEPELHHINVGGSFFWQDGLCNTNFDLTSELYAMRGGFLSVILGQQMYLNVDVVHKAFVVPQEVGPLYDRYKNDNNDTINKLLKDLKVTYQIPGRNQRSYRLDGLGLKPDEHKFIYGDGEARQEISVANYFAQQYNYRLNLTWRCLVVKGQQTYLPPELCTIVSGQSAKKLNDVQTSKMIKIATMTAPVREVEIKEVFKKLVENNSDIMRHEFQLSVENEMETVNARILNAPNIIYANRTVNVSKGTWQMQKFKQPINLERNQWTILCIKGNKDDEDTSKFKMQEFMEKLKKHADNVGMRVNTADTNSFERFKKFKPIEIKKHIQKYKELKLIIVIIPNSPGTIYNEIKQITELELGILTQCIKFINYHNVFVQRKERSIIRNILLKINTKLNGINHALDPRPKCFEKICMFVGADVTHPSYDESKPSIAAVTASNDIDGLQYNVIHKVLPSKQEIIMDLKNIIDVQLSIYKDKTSRLPERIIYYRDGVSEGQLPQVMHYEIEAIRDAYKNKCKSDIEITCLIVQKRHHVRLFPILEKNKKTSQTKQENFPEQNEQIDDTKNGNVNAGTIVDSKITHPSHFDFYLVSHASIQGTARPTKYKCICNDSNFTENEIEELTYYLCHMYARCTRTVSYPVPTYYAHLAAYRGKVLLHGYSDNDDKLREIQERFNTKMANLPMYFV